MHYRARKFDLEIYDLLAEYAGGGSKGRDLRDKVIAAIPDRVVSLTQVMNNIDAEKRKQANTAKKRKQANTVIISAELPPCP